MLRALREGAALQAVTPAGIRALASKPMRSRLTWRGGRLLCCSVADHVLFDARSTTLRVEGVLT